MNRLIAPNHLAIGLLALATLARPLPVRANPPPEFMAFRDYLATLAHTGPLAYACFPGSQASMEYTGLEYGLMLARLAGDGHNVHLFHGTTDSTWGGNGALTIRPNSFYGLSINYPTIHTLMSPMFPNSLDQNDFVLKNASARIPHANVREYTVAASAQPDILLGYQQWPPQVLDAWSGVAGPTGAVTVEYAAQRAVPHTKVNIAATRTLGTAPHLAQNYATQLFHTPVRGLVVQREFTPGDFSLLVKGWMTWKAGNGALPHIFSLDNAKQELNATHHLNLARFACLGHNSPCAPDALALRYDELILFGTPAAHVQDHHVDDAFVAPDAVVNGLAAWVESCSAAAPHPAYSPDYTTFVPFRHAKEAEGVAGWQARKTTQTTMVNWMLHGGRTLGDIRTANAQTLALIEKELRDRNLVEPLGAAGSLRLLVNASQHGSLTFAQISEVREYAHSVLEAICKLEHDGVATLGKRAAPEGNDQWVDPCRRQYVDLAESPDYFEDLRDDTTKHCKWDYQQAKCVPGDLCKRKFKFGDVTLSQSCRLRH